MAKQSQSHTMDVNGKKKDTVRQLRSNMFQLGALISD